MFPSLSKIGILGNLKKIKIFTLLFWSLILILLFSRAMPYILHGYFGFGYDTGIYKKIFENTTTFYSVLHSELYLFPAFLAYIFNLFGLPISWLLYFGHIFFSTAVVIPLYLLTKQYFGRVAGIIAVVLFTVSYVQVFASEFYLFKAEIGAFFMLFSFYFYAKRSLWFYLFAFLLAITQLPQFLILFVGVGVSAIFNFKKDFKYHLIAALILLFSFLLLWFLTPQHLINAYEVVIGGLTTSPTTDMHNIGLFIGIGEFSIKGLAVILLSIGGLCVAFKKKNILPLYAGVLFLAIVVFGQLFFERRFIMELDLLMIPFASYLLVVVLEWLCTLLRKFTFFKVSVFKAFAGVILLAISLGFTGYYFFTTHPAISSFEKWALDIIAKETDSNYVMVTDTTYAPWFYGFSNKITLAPGIFESVWNFEQHVKFHSSGAKVRADMLIEVAQKYGDFYLFEGSRQKGEHVALEKESPFIKKIFEVGNVTIYKVSKPPIVLPPSPD